MEKTMKTISQFIEEQGLTATVKRTDTNPNMAASEHMTRHFEVIITASGYESIMVYFSQGSAHKEPPTLADVLNCLALDCSVADLVFEEFCADFGYDTDSRTAERIHDVCQGQAAELRELLDEEAYQELLYNVERM